MENRKRCSAKAQALFGTGRGRLDYHYNTDAHTPADNPASANVSRHDVHHNKSTQSYKSEVDTGEQSMKLCWQPSQMASNRAETWNPCFGLREADIPTFSKQIRCTQANKVIKIRGSLSKNIIWAWPGFEPGACHIHCRDDLLQGCWPEATIIPLDLYNAIRLTCHLKHLLSYLLTTRPSEDVTKSISELYSYYWPQGIVDNIYTLINISRNNTEMIENYNRRCNTYTRIYGIG